MSLERSVKCLTEGRFSGEDARQHGGLNSRPPIKKEALSSRRATPAVHWAALILIKENEIPIRALTLMVDDETEIRGEACEKEACIHFSCQTASNEGEGLQVSATCCKIFLPLEPLPAIFHKQQGLIVPPWHLRRTRWQGTLGHRYI